MSTINVPLTVHIPFVCGNRKERKFRLKGCINYENTAILHVDEVDAKHLWCKPGPLRIRFVELPRAQSQSQLDKFIVPGGSPSRQYVYRTHAIDMKKAFAKMDGHDVDVVICTMPPTLVKVEDACLAQDHIVAAYFKPDLFTMDLRHNYVDLGNRIYRSIVRRNQKENLVTDRRLAAGRVLQDNNPKSADLNAPLQRLLSDPAKCPRHNDGSIRIVLNTHKKSGLLVVYCRQIAKVEPCEKYPKGKPEGPREAIHYLYNSPQFGGSQYLISDQLENEPLLLQFPACRVLLAMICVKVNQDSRPNKNGVCQAKPRIGRRMLPTTASFKMLLEYGVAVRIAEDVEKELQEDVKRAREEGKKPPTRLSRKGEGSRVANSPLARYPLYWLALIAKHTLNCYATCFHADVFADNNGDSIENKMLMFVTDCAHMALRALYGKGRRGLKDEFAIALLDWPAAIIHRRAIYQQFGGAARASVCAVHMVALADRLQQQATQTGDQTTILDFFQRVDAAGLDRDTMQAIVAQDDPQNDAQNDA